MVKEQHQKELIPVGIVCTKREFLAHLFLIFKKNKIGYLVNGEYHQRPENTVGSELDIIVNQKEILRMVVLLTDFLKKYEVKVISYYTDSKVLRYRLLGESDIQWTLHLNLSCKGSSLKQRSIAQFKRVAKILSGKR